MRRTEAIFEQGVLRPLEPLTLKEKQHVLITISDLPDARSSGARREEQHWLDLHGHEYSGQSVALQNNELISHGRSARFVRDEARRKGLQRPLLGRISDEPDRPSIGWL